MLKAIKLILLAPIVGLTVGHAMAQSATGKRTLVSADALIPMTCDQYPTWCLTFGNGGLLVINLHMALAARQWAAEGACDRIDYIGPSDRSLVDRSKIIVFANCRDGKRLVKTYNRS